jgi:formimidoylglutamate deiminase
MCLGSDSQAAIDLLLEARELEGHLRLLRLRRAALDSGTGDPSGLARDLLKAATIQGARALGLTSGELKVGSPADFFTVDWSHPSLLGASGDRALASLVFAAEKGAIRDVAVAGQLIVQDGQHRLLDESASAFRALCETVYA